ncbi:MAG: energy transducer TonB [Blastocatellia bacterium]
MRRFASNRTVITAVIVLIACVGIAVPGRAAQDPAIDALAARMAEAIVGAKQKSVVVFDFAGPDKGFNALGEELADSLSSSLSKSAASMVVIDRASLRKEVEDNRLSPEITDPQLMTWLADKLRAKTVVVGNFSQDGAVLTIHAESYEFSDGKAIASLQVKEPMTDDMKAPLKNGPDANIPDFDFHSKDEKVASCRRCPRPNYSEQAMAKKISDTVLLDAVIGIDGRARDIRVKKSAPLGLTIKAIQAVQSWIFRPAVGPDGKPVAVRLPIEITFRTTW